MAKIDLNTLGYPEAPKIVVTPPGPRSKEIFQKIQTVIPQQVYGMFPERPVNIIWESAKGDTVRDVDGNVYIDLTAGYHTTSTGHCPPQVIEAVSNAASKLINTASWSHELRYEAAKKILNINPSTLNRVVIGGGSGFEATLGAVRAARLFKKCDDVIVLYQHFGSSSPLRHRPYPENWYSGPAAGYGHVLMAPAPDCYHCPFKMEYPDCGIYCAEFIEQIIKVQSQNNTAAVMLEPWPRRVGAPEGYLAKLRKICDDNDILMIADEIVMGMGRTGKWWACEWENVVPDIRTSAKGLTSGFQGNAIISSEEILNALPIGSQVHSFCTNPMTCAAIVSTIDLIQELDLVNNAHTVGELIRKRLLEMQSEHEMIGAVTCKGLSVGMTIVKDKTSREVDLETTTKVFVKLFQKGVLNYGRSWVSPPLCLTKEHAIKAMDLLEESIQEVEKL